MAIPYLDGGSSRSSLPMNKPPGAPNETVGYLRSLLAGVANKIEAGKTENLVAEIREYLRTTSNAESSS